MKKTILTLLVVLVILVGRYYLLFNKKSVEVSSFQECVAAGYPVQESFPRKCSVDEQTFTEDIGNVLEKNEIIKIDNPRPNQKISSPLEINGEAKGTWYFEASFSAELKDGKGETIKEIPITTQENWMTEDFVSYEETMEFNTPETATGTLILHKANPSGMSENEDQLIVPIKFN